MRRTGLRRWLRLALLRLVGFALRSGPLDRPVAPVAAERARVLLIRPDHLGDLLLTAPAVAALRSALPGARLTYLVGPWASEAVRRGPPVDDLLTLEFPGFTREPKGSLLAPYLLAIRWAGRLRRERFDAALVLRPDHWWGALLAALARIPVRIGYGEPECRPFLSHALPLDPRSHSVVRSLALVEALTALLAPSAPSAEQRSRKRRARSTRSSAARPAPGAARAGAPSFAITPAEERFAAGALASLGGSGPLVAIHPGSGAALKSWPIDRWGAVAAELAERLGARVVALGGPGEADQARAVAAAVPDGRAIALSGLPLGAVAALLRRADLTLGVDSGPLHLATALGTPTVRLYGPTDEAIYGPWGPPERHAVVRVPLPCAPCGNLVAPPCGARAEPACLQRIEVATVVAEAERLLARERRG